MNILIGSRAMKHWYPNFPLKENADWDIVSDKRLVEGREGPNGEPYEFHDVKLLNNEKLEQWASWSGAEYAGERLYILRPAALAMVKRSHLHRNLGFQKHITHYHKVLTDFRLRNQDDLGLIGFLNERTTLTKKEFPTGNPNLNQPVKEFFDDYVTKKYDHDHLHTLVAYEDKPMYTKLQDDPSLAWCDKYLWDKLDHQQKIYCVAEETQVIAMERFLVPHDWQYSVKHAYLKALDKVCTTLTSGWFRDFAIEYYPEVFNLCDAGKFDRIRKELKNGN